MTQPKPDHREKSYEGCNKLLSKAAVISGGDSGLGRAVAIPYAREDADVLVSSLDEHEDAQEAQRWVEQAGRKCVLAPGDIADPAHCRAIIQRAAGEFGRLNILVNNAAFQVTRTSLEETPDEEWIKTPRTDCHAMLFLSKAALPHMKLGSSIVNTTSVNSDKAPPKLIAEKGIQANSMAPGPIWTPLIPATVPPEQVESVGQEVPLKRPGQLKEVATLFVFLAPDDASYVTSARYAATGGTPILQGVGIMQRTPLKLSTPVVQHVFGGRRVPDRLGKTGLSDGRIAETWECGDVNSKGAAVLQDGPPGGQSLRALVEQRPDEQPVGRGWRGLNIPVLTRFIDGSGMLPVRLHADGLAARTPKGKTEAWHTLDDGIGATALMGLKDGVDSGADPGERLRAVFAPFHGRMSMEPEDAGTSALCAAAGIRRNRPGKGLGSPKNGSV